MKQEKLPRSRIGRHLKFRQSECHWANAAGLAKSLVLLFFSPKLLHGVARWGLAWVFVAIPGVETPRTDPGTNDPSPVKGAGLFSLLPAPLRLQQLVRNRATTVWIRSQMMRTIQAKNFRVIRLIGEGHQKSPVSRSILRKTVSENLP